MLTFQEAEKIRDKALERDEWMVDALKDCNVTINVKPKRGQQGYAYLEVEIEDRRITLGEKWVDLILQTGMSEQAMFNTQNMNTRLLEARIEEAAKIHGVKMEEGDLLFMDNRKGQDVY